MDISNTLCIVLWLAMQSPILSIPESTCNILSTAVTSPENELISSSTAHLPISISSYVD